MDVSWTYQNRGADLDILGQTVAELGEIRLLKEIILPDVSFDNTAENDDCAYVSLATPNLLWSMDPCPTPVANWFDKASAQAWGHYTATINLSDIAASGGTPVGMLVSIEMPDDTPVAFVKDFQTGLMTCLRSAGARLLGGNVKSAKKFSATGTIIGIPGPRRVTRQLDSKEVDVYLIGSCGAFWTSVIANRNRFSDTPKELIEELDNALCFPSAQTEAGTRLGNLPFPVACMDCSDGAANAVHQLAALNKLDIKLFSQPQWQINPALKEILEKNNVALENACYAFGDWQLACLVRKIDTEAFETEMSSFRLTNLGAGKSGSGAISLDDGRYLSHDRINQNFQGGYNSINSLDELIESFLIKSIFS